jgi:hypothetical protein
MIQIDAEIFVLNTMPLCRNVRTKPINKPRNCEVFVQPLQAEKRILVPAGLRSKRFGGISVVAVQIFFDVTMASKKW